MLIQLKALTLAYQRGPTLEFPDLDLPDGQGLLLRGASGSGKSTLLALMAGLLTPSRGMVRVKGTELGRLDAAQRDAWRGANLGFVPQRLHLSAALTVKANLDLPYVAAGLAADRVRAATLLAELGLTDVQQRRPHELSLGQAQRVALARALVRRPSLLLADEPTANLDDEAAAVVLRMLQQASLDHGASLIVATHDSRVEHMLGSALHRLDLPRAAEVAQ